jgi:hypothetical protein
VTKNILSVVQERSATIDWLMGYMTLPLATPVHAREGDVLQVSFQYRAGGPIPSLQASLQAEVLYQAALQPQRVPAYA